MKLRNSWISGALAALATTCVGGVGWASSHAEAPGTASDPEIDNADVWAWREGTNLEIIATYNGLQPAYAAPNWKKFGDDALYEIHLVRGVADLKDDLVYQIKFSSAAPVYHDPANHDATPAGGNEFFAQITGSGAFAQTYTVTKIENGTATQLVTGAAAAKVAPPNVGPRTNAIAFGIPNGTTYEQFFVDNGATSVVKSLGAGQGRIFAGPRDDPFFVDLGAVFDLAGLRPVIGGAPRDSVAYSNVMTIALEIPIDVAKGGAVTAYAAGNAANNNANLVGVWASASRRKTTIRRRGLKDDNFGPFVQVSRLGLPLINEAVIGLQDKDYWNRLRPSDDVPYFGAYFLNPMLVRDAEFAGFYAGGGPLATFAPSSQWATNRTDILSVINLDDIPAANDHSLTLPNTGDVLRVDLGIPQGNFPNGRRLLYGNGPVTEADVVAIELSLILTGNPAAGVDDGVTQVGDGGTIKPTFPYMNTPWESFSAGIYGAPSP